MNRLVKCLAAGLSVIMALSLAACGNTGTASSAASETAEPAAAEAVEATAELAAEPTAEPAEAAAEAADTVIFGTIYTADDNDSVVKAAAIKDGKFIYVGDAEGAKAYIGSDTETYTADEAALVIPGFIDGHTHITASVSSKFSDMILLNSYSTKDEYLKAIKEFIESHPDQQIYSGTGWINGGFPDDNGCPTAEMLDEIESEKPIMLRSTDGHSIWCNTAMMNLAGITADTANPSGGTIERKADGKTPNGCFRDTAEDMILKALPVKDITYYERGILAAQKYYAALGYTAYQEIIVNESANTLQAPMAEAYEALDEMGLLTMHVEGGIQINNDEQAMETLDKAIALKESTAGGMFEVTTIKIYMDGVVEGKTALMSEPYTFDSSYYGVGRWTTEEDLAKLAEIVEKANAAGLTVHFHSDGDAAITTAIDAVEKAYSSIGEQVLNCRNALTHLQVVKTEDMERMSKLNMQAVCNPWGQKTAGYFNEIEVNYLGQERADSEYPVKSFKENGVNISYATDFSAGSIVNPIESFHVFVTRTTADDSAENVQNPGEALSRVECLRQMTRGGAHQLGLEDTLGSIEVGKDANIAVLSKNLLEIPDDEIMSTQVVATMCNGEWTYAKAGESAYTDGAYINVVDTDFYDTDGSLNGSGGETALSIEKTADGKYAVTVEQYYGGVFTEWVMTGSYDEATDSIYYEGAVKTEDGTEVYSDGKGYVRLRDGAVLWLSLKEPETSLMIFFNIEDIIAELEAAAQ